MWFRKQWLIVCEVGLKNGYIFFGSKQTYILSAIEIYINPEAPVQWLSIKNNYAQLNGQDYY